MAIPVAGAVDAPATVCHTFEQLLDGFDALLLESMDEPVNACPEATLVGHHIDRSFALLETLVSAAEAATIVHVVYHMDETIRAQTFDPAALRRRLSRLWQMLGRWRVRPMDSAVIVDQIVWPSGDTIRGWSTLADEAAFVVGDIVHRQKAIAHLGESLGMRMPPHFAGVALPALRARSSVPHWRVGASRC